MTHYEFCLEGDSQLAYARIVGMSGPNVEIVAKLTSSGRYGYFINLPLPILEKILILEIIFRSPVFIKPRAIISNTLYLFLRENRGGSVLLPR